MWGGRRWRTKVVVPDPAVFEVCRFKNLFDFCRWRCRSHRNGGDEERKNKNG